jgi:hypothetical protein
MLSINIITRAVAAKNRRVCTKRCNRLDSGAAKTAPSSRFDAQRKVHEQEEDPA